MRLRFSVHEEGSGRAIPGAKIWIFEDRTGNPFWGFSESFTDNMKKLDVVFTGQTGKAMAGVGFDSPYPYLTLLVQAAGRQSRVARRLIFEEKDLHFQFTLRPEENAQIQLVNDLGRPLSHASILVADSLDGLWEFRTSDDKGFVQLQGLPSVEEWNKNLQVIARIRRNCWVKAVSMEKSGSQGQKWLVTDQVRTLPFQIEKLPRKADVEVLVQARQGDSNMIFPLHRLSNFQDFFWNSLHLSNFEAPARGQIQLSAGMLDLRHPNRLTVRFLPGKVSLEWGGNDAKPRLDLDGLGLMKVKLAFGFLKQVNRRSVKFRLEAVEEELGHWRIEKRYFDERPRPNKWLAAILPYGRYRLLLVDEEPLSYHPEAELTYWEKEILIDRPRFDLILGEEK
ncbi:MAG: hypothetical protein DWQ01_11150 [Planctomycetota bacterium]|nr:MAG: hypothetical protein DWQ01_11150 [Planctomycetota bacterium]